jgi:hypothetical protein
MELVNFYEKIPNLSYSYPRNHIEDDIMQNHEEKKIKKVKAQDSMGKTSLFFGTLLFSLWIVSIWLHMRDPQKM